MNGMLGVYLTAAELTAKGLIVSITSRNAKGADLLVADHEYKKTWSIQVKTNGLATTFWLINKDFKTEVSETHIYVFVNLRGDSRPQYYVVPSKFVADHGYVKPARTGSHWYQFDAASAVGCLENWSLFTGAARTPNNNLLLFKIANTLFQALDRKAPRLFDHIVSVIFKSDPSRFFKTHYVTVDGTNQALIRFEFDADAFWLAFDAEFSTALRTMRLEYPRRNNISHGDHSEIGAPS